ncbi:hypothetical protein PR202_gb08213 [Eleusine coracana subsp. coracana]|uniref:GDSL esterase/lipase n=1 Tax=Eleusine coracana subsp. coracana TaxID=191504 RepID=A0AAV5EDB8_ELECO|nr:hypothetical protein PR202_gb08213 [Eleusine coracana subsp. coracana]
MARRWLVAVVLAAVGLLATPSESARAFFVFGDSLVDNGNNNYLMTTARANAPPYGIDYPTHRATGRFSNGKNIPDIISTSSSLHAVACSPPPPDNIYVRLSDTFLLTTHHAGEHLGAEPVLPYLSPDLGGDKLLVGANFASAGVGILNDTGIQFVNILRMNQQLAYFGEYKRKLAEQVGPARARQVVRRSLVLITVGGNDFVNNYYLVPFSLRSREFSLPDYVRYLISEYKKILIVRVLLNFFSSFVSVDPSPKQRNTARGNW